MTERGPRIREVPPTLVSFVGGEWGGRTVPFVDSDFPGLVEPELPPVLAMGRSVYFREGDSYVAGYCSPGRLPR